MKTQSAFSYVSGMWHRLLWYTDTSVSEETTASVFRARLITPANFFFIFYILLTVHHVMILDKWPTRCTILFCVFIFIFNSLHVSSTSCSSSGETNCVNTTSGSCRWPCRVHTTRPPTKSNSYQRLYRHNLFLLLMMSTMCSKHLES